MAIHVRIWTGGPSAAITDMTNAGKRGKVCRVYRFGGIRAGGWKETPETKEATSTTMAIMDVIEQLKPEVDFDDATAPLRTLMELATAKGAPVGYIHASDETIRGIDAPVPVLTAGGPGWSAQADNDGVTILDHIDRNNEPAMITGHQQKKSQAYRIAAKVWESVKAATSFHDAGEILRAAGCCLHYYCRMD